MQPCALEVDCTARPPSSERSSSSRSRIPPSEPHSAAIFLCFPRNRPHATETTVARALLYIRVPDSCFFPHPRLWDSSAIGSAALPPALRHLTTQRLFRKIAAHSTGVGFGAIGSLDRYRELMALFPNLDCNRELLDLAHAELRESCDCVTAIGLCHATLFACGLRSLFEPIGGQSGVVGTPAALRSLSDRRLTGFWLHRAPIGAATQK